MVNAIVLAGGKVKMSFFDPFKLIGYYLIYGEKYYFTTGKYKPLIKICKEINGIKKIRPLLEYTLYSLFLSKKVDKIVVVGEKERLEDSLDLKIKNYSSNCSIIQQKGSLKENILQGYYFLNKKGPALFISADSPLTTPKSIDCFIETFSKEKKDFDFFFAITSRKSLYKYEKIIHHPYFWVIDDKNTENDSFSDKFGRRGFRVANMAFADPERIDNLKMVDLSYDLRKLRNPLNLFKIFGLYKEEVIKYFNKTLKISEIEKKMSDSFGTRFRLVEIEDPNTSLDIDSEEDNKAIQDLENYQ